MENSEETDDEKWKSFKQINVLSIAMLLGAFVAGVFPLYFGMNQRQVNVCNTLGCGLLLGTALAVIIPEGVHSLYEDHHYDDHDSQDEEEKSMLTDESVMGVALVFGYLLMLYLDQCGNHGHMHAHGGGSGGDYDKISSSSHNSLADLGLQYDSSSSHDGGDDDGKGKGSFEMQTLEESRPQNANAVSAKNTSISAKKRSTLTIGLLIHAAADGIALGATKASSESQSYSKVELVVFFAIMMHKIPAAFALAIYLRNSGLDTLGIQRNLFWFALAAPATAILIFILIHPGFLGLASLSKRAVAFALLFSGGTFLYVALVHTFGELPRKPNGALGTDQLLLITFGALVPLVLGAGHHH